jgi:hypothetical protein
MGCVRCGMESSMATLLPCGHVVAVCWGCGVLECNECKYPARGKLIVAQCVSTLRQRSDIECICACGTTEFDAEALVSACPPTLKAIDFWKSQVRDDTVRRLCEHSGGSLAMINLRGCAKITLDTVLHYVARMPNLRKVYLLKIPAITAHDIDVLQRSRPTVLFGN